MLHIISQQKCAYFDSGRNKRLMIWDLSRLLKHTVFLITKNERKQSFLFKKFTYNLNWVRTIKKFLIDTFKNISQTTLVKQINLKCENLNWINISLILNRKPIQVSVASQCSCRFSSEWRDNKFCRCAIGVDWVISTSVRFYSARRQEWGKTR